MTGTEEEKGKGKTPKEERTCISNLGHTVKNRMTVIYKRMGRYLKSFFRKENFQESISGKVFSGK